MNKSIITIKSTNFHISDLEEADGVLSGTCENYAELVKTAKDGAPISVAGVPRGKISYTWFPISGKFQIYI